MKSVKQVTTSLLKNRNPNLVGSIYIPTHPKSTSQNMSADQTRFKNALQYIRLHPEYDESLLGESMQKLDKLYEDVEFWKYQEQGLAVLFSDTVFEYFKVPFEMTEATYLTDHYVVSPLLVMDAVDTSFYVLDVNVSQPRLLRSTSGELHEVNKENMPGSLDDEVGKDEYNKQLSHQHGGPLGYHGHQDDEVINDVTKRYLRMVAEATDSYLEGHESPLLLAGTENRTGNIRKELQYKAVMDKAHDGSVEKLNSVELYDVVQPITEEYFAGRLAASVQKLSDASPEFVAVGTEEITALATTEGAGRIESLYLPIYRLTKDTVRAGDNTSLVIELPGDIETIEPLVTAVIKQGGSIIPVEIDGYDSLDQPRALCRF